MPNCENPLLMGKGMLLTSVPRNRALSPGKTSETMPTREGGHTAAERHDVASDVTHKTKAVANAGRSVAAGKPFSSGGSGASIDHRRVSNAADWECGSSRKRRIHDEFAGGDPARQWETVCA